MEETQSNTPRSATEAETEGSPAAAANSTSSYAIPAAILLGFGMIAAAIYFGSSDQAAVPMEQDAEAEQATQESEPIPEITEDDHIRGNPNAPIVVVEYSDYDCPFCKQFHETMNSVMDTYGPSGEVAWVYRHFPIDRIHPSAPYIAMASECVAELGGNEAFWTFSDLVFEEREANAMTNTARLPEFAVSAGVDEAAFNECVESERTMPAVEEDMAEAMAAGVRGTPYSFILIAGQQLPVNGAQPLQYMTANIENLLDQLEQAETEGSAEAVAE